MHVLVTGATGFVGFHTVMALLHAGHSVRLGVRSEQKMRELYAPYKVDVSDYVIAEMTDAEAIDRALDGVDSVVHTAAMVSVDSAMAERMYQTNVEGTKLVIGGAVKRGIKSIVHTSSLSTLFAPGLNTINEQSPLVTPINAYARSKIDSESYVRELIAAGANIAVTIPAVIMGPDDPLLSEGNYGLSLFVKYMLMQTTSGQQVIDVRELANVNVKLLEAQKSGLFVVGGHYLPWKAFGDSIDRATGKKMRRITVPAPLLNFLGASADVLRKLIPISFPLSTEAVTYVTRWVIADDRKVRYELGLEYRPIEETFSDTVQWLVKERHLSAQWAENIR